MSPRVISVTEETGIDEAARLLIGERIRRVPVIRGGKMVGLLRLTFILPLNVMNYGLGLSKIPFFYYLLATWLFMMPA